jgi:hypothetical protein
MHVKRGGENMNTEATTMTKEYQSPTVSNISVEPFVVPAIVLVAVVSGAVSGAVSAVVTKAVG